MKEKTKNTGEVSEMIKVALDALLKLNKKRKAALEKLSKSVMEKGEKQRP